MKKFDDPSKLKDSIDVSLKRMGRVLFMPVTSAMRTARMFTQPSSIARKASNDVMGEIKKLKEPPSSLAEYVDGGSHYIARRLLYLLILAALILPALFINFAWPVLQSRFFTRTMPVDSAVAASYTGKVSLTDRDSGTVLFEGSLDKGRINGFGRLYGYDGKRRYEGNFLMEVFDGYGELYYDNGLLRYQGNFSMNKEEGQGIQYYEDQTVSYKGGFVSGLYEGTGTKYREDGSLEYEGGYAGKSL